MENQIMDNEELAGVFKENSVTRQETYKLQKSYYVTTIVGYDTRYNGYGNVVDITFKGLEQVWVDSGRGEINPVRTIVEKETEFTCEYQRTKFSNRIQNEMEQADEIQVCFMATPKVTYEYELYQKVYYSGLRKGYDRSKPTNKLIDEEVYLDRPSGRGMIILSRKPKENIDDIENDIDIDIENEYVTDEYYFG